MDPDTMGAESLVFMMGKHPAPIPVDRRYCRNHMWCRPGEANVHRFGFSAYAIRLMQDVYFLDWSVDSGSELSYKQPIGNIETSKAVSDLFSPIAGKLVSIHQELLRDPSGINVDGYEKGWLFEIEGSLEGTMTAHEYFDHLTSTWESTQRILKGQMGD